MNELLPYARGVHFAATVMVAGIVFFVVFIAEPAFSKASNSPCLAITLRRRLAWIAWICLAVCLLSGAAWLLFTAASMSGQPLAAVCSQHVLPTVLSQTDFGNDWLARLVFACALAGLLVPLLSAKSTRSVWLKSAAITFAAALVGSLAFAGHAIGAEGVEGVVHPAADVLHLIAAAAWVGALVPLALLLAMTGEDAGRTLVVARAATVRFSNLGIAAVATLLITGSINTWYLVGSVPALTGSDYGRLLTIKIVLFLIMVGIAACNWSQLTPKLISNADAKAAQRARRALYRNAAVEAALGAAILAIVAVLGTLPPAAHAGHHHEEYSSVVPPDAAFVHIHSDQGMAEVTIEPGKVGTATAKILLMNDDFETLAAREVTLTLTAPASGSKPVAHAAVRDADGNWQVGGLRLPVPGNWNVEVDAVLGSNAQLKIAAPIVIDAK